MKKIRPLHDRILVKREEEGEEKIGGIIIPDSAKEKPQRAKVVAVGAGKIDDSGKRIPLDVKSGDRILFGKYSGNEVKIARGAPARKWASRYSRRRYRPVASTTQSTPKTSHGTSPGLAICSIRVRNLSLTR
jgi:chaperonin GroES